MPGKDGSRACLGLGSVKTRKPYDLKSDPFMSENIQQKDKRLGTNCCR